MKNNRNYKRQDHIDSNQVCGFIAFCGLVLAFVFLVVMSLVDHFAPTDSILYVIYQSLF